VKRRRKGVEEGSKQPFTKQSSIPIIFQAFKAANMGVTEASLVFFRGRRATV
jgi:hypothetical protein